MNNKLRGALILGITGGIIGGLIGILLGVFIIIGISISAPHPESIGVSLIGFIIVLSISILLGAVFGYYFKRYKFFFIIGLIGVILQVIILFLTFNLNMHNKILYWISFPGTILIIFLILGLIIQKIKK